ncbi:MAG: type II secretion system F family protein [Patescibacteria group bacterium]
MPNFTYKALNEQHQMQSGTHAAKTKQEVAQSLVKRGLSVLVIKEITEKSSIKGTIPQLDKIIFCRYLSTMLSSGLSLSEGIDVLRNETKHPLMRQILGDMSYSLEQGQQLSSVFERYPNVFESYFLTLTRAGEVSGTLTDVFKYLESELRAEYSLSSKVKGALLYPSVVFTAMIGIGVLMFFFVLPQIGKVFLNLKLPLPAFTKFLFTFSLALSSQMIPLLVSSVLLIILAFFLLKKPQVRDLLFHVIRPIPLVRDLIKKIDLARFTRIFSTLLRSAVPITEALEISLKSMSWPDYRKLATVFPDEIRKGKTLADVVRGQHAFPTLVVQMIATGERSGKLDSSLAELASFYEEEVEEELKNLTQILEPVLMLLVGIAVGAMILSIIAPIYSVVGSFQQAAGGPGSK